MRTFKNLLVTGGENEWQNIELLQELINLVAEETGKPAEALRGLITYVKDRPGHRKPGKVSAGIKNCKYMTT